MGCLGHLHLGADRLGHHLLHALVQRLLVEHRPLCRAYQHELANIISIVKPAAVGDPLLSAEERVRVGRASTPQQERWLNLIRNHLVENLAVDREDFPLHPRRRHWGRVTHDFESRLEAIIAQINEAMAL